MAELVKSSYSANHYICTPPNSHSPQQPHYLLYFITGNPGLIGYYTTFLNTLASLLSQNDSSASADAANSRKPAYTVAGKSLLGFGTATQTTRPGPFNLEEVIEDAKSNVLSAIQKGESENGTKYSGVILMGHSVGGYISLEVIRRLRASPPSTLSLKTTPIDAILLFPTVTHIAKSPQGIKFSKMFARFSNAPELVHQLSQFGFWPLSDGVMKTVIKWIMRMDDTTSEATARFLKSEKGVRQALFLARDEMETITEDRWDEEVWGVEKEENEIGERIEPPRLVFYFGERDHWVADHTRDALIKARYREGNGKVKMVIDDNKIPHGFCIRK